MSRGKSERPSTNGSKQGSTRELIRKVRQVTRRKYPAEEKIRIVLEGICGGPGLTDS